MKLGELLDLGCQICRRRLLNRSRVLRWGWRILLRRLRIGCALLIGLIILLLCSRILRRIFLLLVVGTAPASADDGRRAYGSAPKRATGLLIIALLRNISTS